MDEGEPRARHRGFFLHSDTIGEPDAGEHENPEGVAVRVRTGRPAASRQLSRMAHSRGRSMVAHADESSPQIRSGSVTGSRQRAHLPR
jgi:hypothetical protein